MNIKTKAGVTTIELSAQEKRQLRAAHELCWNITARTSADERKALEIEPEQAVNSLGEILEALDK